MFKKTVLLSLLFAGIIFMANAQVIPLPASMQLPFNANLPNNKWHLADNGAPDHYIFKRESIKDPQGEDIVPAIMIYVESKDEVKADMGPVYTDHPVADLRDYFEAFWDEKMMPMQKSGIKIKKISTVDDKDYPLSYHNISVFVTGEYSADGFDHLVYMAYIMDKQNRGIQIYMDMTKSVQNICDKEFMDFIRSVKEN